MNMMPRQPDDIAARVLVEVTTDAAQVAEQWAALEPFGTVFQTRAWLLPWYRLIAPGFGASALFVSVIERSTHRPLMLLPLCRRRRHGVVTIEFPDLEVSDYNSPLQAPDFILTPEETQQLWTAIRQALPRADVVRFDKVPQTISGRPNMVARLDWLQEMNLRSWTLTLPPTREEYVDRVLRKKDRKEQQRKRKKIEGQDGKLAFFVATTESEGREIFQALCKERRERFGDKNRDDILGDATYLAFYDAVSFENWGPHISLAALKAGDKIIATLFAVCNDNCYCLVMHSFDLALASLSPGIVAIDEAIAYTIDNQFKYFDFTVGNEGYKQQFGVTEGVLFTGVYPLTMTGKIYEKARRSAKNCGKFLEGLNRRVRNRNSLPRAEGSTPA